MSSPCQIRIAYCQRIPGGASTGEMILVDGAGGMGAIGISEVEVLDPSSTGPSIADPSSAGLSVADPSSACPSVADPSSAGPSVADSTSSGTQVATVTEDPIVADPTEDIPTQQSKTSDTTKIIKDAIATGRLKTAGLKKGASLKELQKEQKHTSLVRDLVLRRHGMWMKFLLKNDV
ncbi:hypothetical protein Tco_0426014 [Tanacetum coccineum]